MDIISPLYCECIGFLSRPRDLVVWLRIFFDFPIDLGRVSEQYLIWPTAVNVSPRTSILMHLCWRYRRKFRTEMYPMFSLTTSSQLLGCTSSNVRITVNDESRMFKNAIVLPQRGLFRKEWAHLSTVKRRDTYKNRCQYNIGIFYYLPTKSRSRSMHFCHNFGILKMPLRLKSVLATCNQLRTVSRIVSSVS
jgi:hypothetical protein